MGARAKAALPPLLRTLTGSFLWALAMCAGAGFSLYLRHWYRTPQMLELMAIFFAGGLAAWPLARFASGYVAPNSAGTRRIAADVLATSGATVGFTALFYALQFRAQHAEMHSHGFSAVWIINFVFTVLGAIYQFLVLGLGLFVPALVIGLPAYLIWKLLPARR